MVSPFRQRGASIQKRSMISRLMTKSVDTGRKLYKQACYKCHGPNGVSGGTIPDLRKYAAKADHYEMFMVIQAGRLDLGMPAWNDYLTEDEIKKIIVYVKALHKK